MITYPLNNIDYTAEDAELFHCTRTSGIWAEDSFPISVTGADNNVTVGKGLAWINNEEFSGKVAALKSAEVLDLGIADGSYPRIDVIAIQYNANNNGTDIIVKKGTPATNPVRPAIVRTGAIYELYLASVYRPAGATAITASNITDLRMDRTVCGLMTDAVTKVDMDAIHAQLMGLVEELENAIQNIEVGEIVPIEKGGTNARTVEKARQNINFIGVNPIASTNDDTTENWIALGTGVAVFTENRLENQPYSYMIVENIVTETWVSQIAVSLSGAGEVWKRSGNSNGWYIKTKKWLKNLDENSGIQIKLLWENARPTSSFPPQTINIDFSGYTHYYVEFALAASDYNSQTIPSPITSINRIAMGVYGWGDYNRIGNRRVGAITSTSISFADGYYNTGVNNDAVIPIKIYGIKGVQ